MGELRILDDWYGDQSLPYQEAWDLQRRLLTARADDLIPDTALFLEHPPVYTAGKRTEPHERPIDGTPVIDVDRGGKITFHGPGQLVGYPITKLPSHVLVVDYVRRVEEALIRAVADLGVASGRVPGRSGVWLPADDARLERPRAEPGRSARSPRSASASRAVSRCTGSRSTPTSTCRGTTGSSRAASPTRA